MTMQWAAPTGRVARLIIGAGLVVALAGCGDDADSSGGHGGSGGVATGGTGGSGGGGAGGSGGSATGGAGGSAPEPDPVDPCGAGACWPTEIASPLCTTISESEDFSSGNYNVHSYEAVAWHDATLSVSLTREAGAWTPALVLRDRDGRTLFDGAVGLQSDGWMVTATVLSADEVAVEVETEETHGLEIVVTSQACLDAGMAASVDAAAEYTLTLTGDCGVAPLTCEANGHTVADPACAWLHFVGRRVVPRLSGSRDEQLQAASRVAWWSLKEGVLMLDDPIGYSNCADTGANVHIGPLEVCQPGYAWQVGLSGVQAAYLPTATVEATATTIYPNLTLAEILTEAAAEAGLGSADANTIIADGDDLRRSWLLRDTTIGFTHQEPIVTSECVDQSLSWCFGSDWPSTAMFAPTKNAALQAMADLYAMFDQLAP